MSVKTLFVMFVSEVVVLAVTIFVSARGAVRFVFTLANNVKAILSPGSTSSFKLQTRVFTCGEDWVWAAPIT